MLSHPRSGSTWFMTGLRCPSYLGWEIFDYKQRNPQTDRRPPMYYLPFERKMQLLQNPGIAHKIHFIQIANLSRPYQAKLVEFLQGRNDLYLLTRVNRQAAVISWLIAYHHGLYHVHQSRLREKFQVTRSEVDSIANVIHITPQEMQTQFQYREQWVYEDLMSGQSRPTTVDWNPTRSRLTETNSV
jgi:hypothetical protein